MAATTRPAPGVRAGNAAPRPAPDEIVGDDLVARAVGLPGVVGTAVVELDQRDWGAGPLGLDAAPAPAAGEECGVCGVGRAAAELAAGALPTAEPGPLELCPPHAWLAVERAGVAA